CRVDIGGALDAEGFGAERLRHAGEVGVLEVGRDGASGKPFLLVETNGAVGVVVGDDDRDRKAILNRGRELVAGHEEPTVTHERDRASTEAPRRGHRAGYAEAHGSRDRAQQTMRRLEWKVAPEPAGEIPGIVHEY